MSDLIYVRMCEKCHDLNDRPRAKTCNTCHQKKLTAYGKRYRKKNWKICRERSRLSTLKNRDYYLQKRREYYRKKHGLPMDHFRPKRKNGEGGIDAQGYKTLSKRGHPNAMDDRGRIREHIFVMSEHLGRPLITKDESVHHKNGDRLDNRIENLELWSKGHPPGQRVEDKIKWYIEFLERYGYKITKE